MSNNQMSKPEMKKRIEALEKDNMELREKLKQMMITTQVTEIVLNEKEKTIASLEKALNAMESMIESNKMNTVMSLSQLNGMAGEVDEEKQSNGNSVGNDDKE